VAKGLSVCLGTGTRTDFGLFVGCFGHNFDTTLVPLASGDTPCCCMPINAKATGCQWLAAIQGKQHIERGCSVSAAGTAGRPWLCELRLCLEDADSRPRWSVQVSKQTVKDTLASLVAVAVVLLVQELLQDIQIVVFSLRNGVPTEAVRQETPEEVNRTALEHYGAKTHRGDHRPAYRTSHRKFSITSRFSERISSARIIVKNGAAVDSNQRSRMTHTCARVYPGSPRVAAIRANDHAAGGADQDRGEGGPALQLPVAEKLR